MNQNFLSQEEIDALLGNSSVDEEESQLSETEKDIIGEVGNISMSTAATTLSSILNKEVLITTPRVSWIPFEQIIKECDIPKVVAHIKYKEGLKGINLLMMDVTDATIIADLMMGGDGTNKKDVLSELELSAVAEAMNQMIGSASTSMATMLGRDVDILPPDVSLWANELDFDITEISKENYMCKIAFDLNVEGLIQSQIMQIFTKETVNEISTLLMGDTMVTSSIEQSPHSLGEQEYIEEIPSIEKAEEVSTEKISVQKPAFPPLTKPSEERKAPRNLDLIMDVPLELSVVLGKTRKTIKEVLSFGNGSIIELNKLTDEPLEIYVNGKLIAQGEVVVINENFGIRITNILSKEQRVKNLK